MQSNEASSGSSSVEHRNRRKIFSAIGKIGSMIANIALGTDIRSVQKNYHQRSAEEQMDGDSVTELDYYNYGIENKNATYHGQTKYSARPPIHYDFKSTQATSARRKSSTTSCESDFNHSRDGINEELANRMAVSSCDASNSTSGHIYRYHRRSSSNSSNINPSFKPDEDDDFKSRSPIESNKTIRPTTLDLSSEKTNRKQTLWHNRSISPIHSSPDSCYDLNSPSSPSSTPQRTVRFNFVNAYNIPKTSHNSAIKKPNNPKATLMDTPADGQQLDATIPLTAISGNRKVNRRPIDEFHYKAFGDYL